MKWRLLSSKRSADAAAAAAHNPNCPALRRSSSSRRVDDVSVPVPSVAGVPPGVGGGPSPTSSEVKAEVGSAKQCHSDRGGGGGRMPNGGVATGAELLRTKVGGDPTQLEACAMHYTRRVKRHGFRVE